MKNSGSAADSVEPELEEPAPPQRDAERKEIVFHGIAASPGIAIGQVLLLAGHHGEYDHAQEDRQLNPDELNLEIERFKKALDKTRNDIIELQKRVQSSLEEREASIFDAHLLIVDDQMLMMEVTEFIRKKGKTAEAAFTQTIQRYISAISAMQDQYLKERADDVKDVASRIVSNLRGLERPVLDHLPGQRVIISRDLTPSDTALLDRENVQAFAIETGSRTSHTAILARSMKIPAVVGMQHIVERLHNGDLIIVDGFIGLVIVNPKQETLELYALKESKKEKFYADLLKESRLRPETLDGYCVQLAANIESIDDIEDAKRYGAAGVGLFRTEFLFINEIELPSEEKQFQIYKKAAEAMQGQPVVIRTLDLGGDKLTAAQAAFHEPNPFLGLRAVRLCLDRPEIIRPQIRAILRAGAFGQVRMMFPMVTCADELDRLYRIVDEVKADLKSSKTPFDEYMEIGIMVEIPSAALAAETLAKKVDFFSIGTNDLVQYTMAVDRGNEKVAYLYQPSHPAILELIKRTVDAAKENSIWVSVCGEMAGDPKFAPLLVGLGVHELSMSPIALGPLRRIVRRLKMHDAETLVAEALKCEVAEKPLELSETLLYRVAPDIVNLAIKGV